MLKPASHLVSPPRENTMHSRISIIFFKSVCGRCYRPRKICTCSIGLDQRCISTCALFTSSGMPAKPESPSPVASPRGARRTNRWGSILTLGKKVVFENRHELHLRHSYSRVRVYVGRPHQHSHRHHNALHVNFLETRRRERLFSLFRKSMGRDTSV